LRNCIATGHNDSRCRTLDLGGDVRGVRGAYDHHASSTCMNHKKKPSSRESKAKEELRRREGGNGRGTCRGGEEARECGPS
jgi:hypothetical protein